MKKLMILAAVLIFGLAAQAQRIGVVDTDYILDNMPEYRVAQEQLDDLAVEWQKEIEQLFSNIDELYQKFVAEAPILPEEEKRRRQEQIERLEREAKELQRKRFGRDGDLFKKRQELIQPIQERVYNAIQEIADNENYLIILDKSAGTAVAYARSRVDISDDVLRRLGYAPGGM